MLQLTLLYLELANFLKNNLKKKDDLYKDIDKAIKDSPKVRNKDIYLIGFIVYNLIYGNKFLQIAIVVVLVVLLFGRGKIPSLMGDVAKESRASKKACPLRKKKINRIQIKIQIHKLINRNATNWMVRNTNYCCCCNFSNWS